MNLRAELLREHSARQTQRLTDYASAHPTGLAQLLQLFWYGEARERQLAAAVAGAAPARLAGSGTARHGAAPGRAARGGAGAAVCAGAGRVAGAGVRYLPATAGLSG